MRYCVQPGCSTLVEAGRCTTHRRDQERYRPNVDVRKLYRTPRWAELRKRKQDEQPFCVECEKAGHLVVWTELDHIVPHRGDLKLFWQEDNLQGLCATHHSSKTGRGL